MRASTREWRGAVALALDRPIIVRVIEPPNYDGPHVPVIVIMTSDNCTYVPHNLKRPAFLRTRSNHRSIAILQQFIQNIIRVK
jgi:hypothetical protein